MYYYIVSIKSIFKGYPVFLFRPCPRRFFFFLVYYYHLSFQGMRIAQDVKQEVLILTDGQSNCNKNATVAARKLQQKAAVFGLMIGKQTLKGEEELKSYVSVPVKQHLFAIDGFQDLKKLLEQIELEINDPRTPPCAPFDIQ